MRALEATQTLVHLCQSQELEAEAEEMWSFVGSKQQQRWLWHVYAFGGATLYDHHTGEVLAFVLPNHQDSAFVQLKALLEPFGIMPFYTDAWGAYDRREHVTFASCCFCPHPQPFSPRRREPDSEDVLKV